MTLNCQQEIGQTIPLTDDETKKLFSISTAQEYDATFIRILLEILYKDDISVLEHRSFTGRTMKRCHVNNAHSGGDSSCQCDQFKAISPKKKDTIFSRFRERIEKCNGSKSDQFKRIQTTNITRLVGMGIANLRKSKQSSNDCPPTERSSLSEI